ncbi:MAG: NADPH-dependent 7-cyano-7-deazaguanine reductase QueF [Neisseriaceae bacterium]|nr:MAG: NADPH-dependent 7-cyano-7-deazaguanine reductase QueF [Neisseriaceae bacterium]
MKKSHSIDKLGLLGNQLAQYPVQYDASILEIFDNPHTGNDYWVHLNCPEFTALCPKTGQPDFARIIISYIPNLYMVESKSLKLYLFSFRNHGGFHEDCVNVIMKDLVNVIQPKYIEVIGLFSPRGGISIYPYANYSVEEEKWQQMAISRLTRFNIIDYD